MFALAVQSPAGTKGLILGFGAVVIILVVAMVIAVGVHRASRAAGRSIYGDLRRESRRGGASSLLSSVGTLASFAFASIALAVVGVIEMDPLARIMAMLVIFILTCIAVSVVRLRCSGLGLGTAIRMSLFPRIGRDRDLDDEDDE